MNNLETYKRIFIETLEIQEEQLQGLEYQGIESWDSIGHMSLMASIEDTFQIMLDMDDIIDFSSFEKGKEILRKYDVEF
jgi:acyl carrier protein